MNPLKPRRRVGVLLLFGGVTLLVLVFVLPFSRLIGKERLTFEREIPASESETLPRAVLPVFSELRRPAAYSGNIYYLSIEKLGIKRALISPNVLVSNLKPDYLNTLNYSLAHLEGTPLPGIKGNSVVFGHSALPYLFSPTNFQTIFTKIDELKFGDIIQVESGSEVFKYRVEKGGLLPVNAAISDFVSTKARLTLITCYPPGFRTEKYAVRALLIN